MIIRHVSDTHGNFPEATQSFDFTVISGDIFPDPEFSHALSGYRDKAYPILAAQYQEIWLEKRKQQLLNWSADKPVYYIHGNHDFLNESSLNRELDWINLNNQFSLKSYLDERELSLYGFPYVPWICGTFNFELNDTAMMMAVAEMVSKFQEYGYPDILVCHTPPYGILDLAHIRLGNHRLTNSLNYTFGLLPKVILCGHIHENHGIEEVTFGDEDFGKLREKVIVSNAATTQNYIEV